MTTLADLVQDVVDITDRGENPAAVRIAVVKATLKAHLAGFWWRDRIEKKIEPDVVNGQQLQIFISSKLAGMRKISYLRGWDDETDPTNPTLMQDFTEIDPVDIKDAYGYLKINKFYAAGDVLTLWADPVPPKLLVGHWIIPNVAEGSFKSWIADMYPSIITDEASADIFGSVGDMDEMRRRRDLFTGNLQIVRMNDVEVTGR